MKSLNAFGSRLILTVIMLAIGPLCFEAGAEGVGGGGGVSEHQPEPENPPQGDSGESQDENGEQVTETTEQADGADGGGGDIDDNPAAKFEAADDESSELVT